MKAYKGFDKDLKCRGFQYEIGKDYKEDKAKLCQKGFHACENPMDVFVYHPPANGRYCEVELDEVSPERKSDSKVAGKKIHIGAEIGITGIINAGVKFILEKAKNNHQKESNTGDQSVATNTGDQSAASVAGKDSIAIVTGIDGKAKGELGCWIVFVERGKWNGETYPIITVKAYCVDGVKVMPNIWYTLKNKRLTKVKE